MLIADRLLPILAGVLDERGRNRGFGSFCTSGNCEVYANWRLGLVVEEIRRRLVIVQEHRLPPLGRAKRLHSASASILPAAQPLATSTSVDSECFRVLRT